MNATTYILLIALTAIATVRGRVIINEIMINSLTTSGQWVELHNTASTLVSLKGWHLHGDVRLTSKEDFEKNMSLNFYFADNATIAANGYLVIGNNASIQGGVGPGGVASLVWATFPNFPVDGSAVEEGINFLYVHGTEKDDDSDLVAWDINREMDPVFRLLFEPGASLSRINPDDEGDFDQNPNNWIASVKLINCISGDRGTPGTSNTDTCPLTTASPTDVPSTRPSAAPIKQPSDKPSSEPSSSPSASPSKRPSASASNKPSARPSAKPSAKPSTKPSSRPSVMPARRPQSRPPTQIPTKQPTPRPPPPFTKSPTRVPVAKPVTRAPMATAPTTTATTAPTSTRCNVPCTFARFAPGVQYHRSTTILGRDVCITNCKIVFRQLFWRRDWKCGGCPSVVLSRCAIVRRH